MDPGKVLAKELFVSHGLGTTLKEIFYLIACVVLSSSLYYLLRIHLRQKQIPYILLFSIESVFGVLPTLLFFTLLSNYTAHLVFGLLLLFFGAFFIIIKPLKVNFEDFKIFESNSLMFLYHCKTSLQFLTAMCILAVDFSVFPRRFAKAEVYGIGVMDTAVGAVIFNIAVTSTPTKRKVTYRYLLNTFKGSVFLVILGMLRTFTINSSNYQQHVTEYGRHWNFFITIAFVKFTVTLILVIFPFLQKQCCFMLVSLLIITVYQTMLSFYGLDFIIQNGFFGVEPRSDFIDANREGIFSSIGYLAIYFFGLFVGVQMNKQKYTMFNKACWLFLWCIIGLKLTIVLRHFGFPISRQMANLSYFAFQVAFNTIQVFCPLVVELVIRVLLEYYTKKEDTIYVCDSPLVSKAIQQYLLQYFLLANLMTGAINIFIDTMLQTDLMAFSIIYIYITILNGIFVFIYLLLGHK